MISLGPFSGRIPGKDSKNLPDGFAKTAINCDLSKGTLQPMADSAGSCPAARAGELRTLFKLDDTWMTWPTQVRAILSELANSDHKFYWTGDGYPKQATKTMATGGAASTYPSDSRRLGVIPPDTALSMAFHTIDGVNPVGAKIVDSVSYYYTRVTADGQESKPCPATGVVDIHENEGVTLTGFDAGGLAQTGNEITCYRIYRLSTGSSGAAQFQMVPWDLVDGAPVYDLPITHTQFVDQDTLTNTVRTASGEVCPSEGWDPAPDDMDSLRLFANGSMVGRSGNVICFAEPGVPSAWPSAYRRNVAGDFVALAALKEVVVVSTRTMLYAFYGSDPASMQKVLLQQDQPCVAADGMVATGDVVFYPATDGIVSHNGVTGRVISAGLFTKAQWRALEPEKMLLVIFDGKLHVFVKGSGIGFIIDYSKAQPDVIDIGLTGRVWAAYVDAADDALYLLVERDGAYCIEDLNNGAARRTMVYESAERSYPAVCLSHGRIRGGQSPDAPINLQIYNDGQVVDELIIEDEQCFSIAPFYAGDVYLRLEGAATVESVTIKVSPEGL